MQHALGLAPSCQQVTAPVQLRPTAKSGLCRDQGADSAQSHSSEPAGGQQQQQQGERPGHSRQGSQQEGVHAGSEAGPHSEREDGTDSRWAWSPGRA